MGVLSICPCWNLSDLSTFCKPVDSSCYLRGNKKCSIYALICDNRQHILYLEKGQCVVKPSRQTNNDPRITAILSDKQIEECRNELISTVNHESFKCMDSSKGDCAQKIL